jgi:post-segregation antitoxin (ccd killing protein)
MARAALGVSIDEDLLDKLRDAAVHLPGATVSGIVEDALRRELARLKRKHGDIPKRTTQPPPGRPVR